MSTGMNHFLYMWREGTLEDDVTWRGYDIPNARLPSHIKHALKALGLAYAGDHAVGQFVAFYEVPQERAEWLLGCWWLWSRICKGRHMRVPRRAAPEGSAATTLAPDGPTPP